MRQHAIPTEGKRFSRPVSASKIRRKGQGSQRPIMLMSSIDSTRYEKRSLKGAGDIETIQSSTRGSNFTTRGGASASIFRSSAAPNSLSSGAPACEWSVLIESHIEHTGNFT